MSVIEQFGSALVIGLGLGLVAVNGLLLYRLLSLVATCRRIASTQRATRDTENTLVARLRAEGFTPEDAEAAVRATRGGSENEMHQGRVPDDTQPSLNAPSTPALPDGPKLEPAQPPSDHIS